jgi:type IV pilus assembly protein PilE
MITVGIVSILAAIAYPSYRTQVLRGGRAEGKAELMEASQEMEKCFTRFGAYNNPLCTAFADMTDGTPRPSERVRYLVSFDPASPPTPTTYVLQAVPQEAQSGDDACGTLGLDQTGLRTKSGDAANVKDCW